MNCYEDKDGITKVNEDVWLTPNHIDSLYKITQRNISLHIKNIYLDRKLEEKYSKIMVKIGMIWIHIQSKYYFRLSFMM